MRQHRIPNEKLYRIHAAIEIWFEKTNNLGQPHMRYSDSMIQYIRDEDAHTSSSAANIRSALKFRRHNMLLFLATVQKFKEGHQPWRLSDHRTATSPA